MKKTLLIALLGAVTLTGCASSVTEMGRPFDAAAVQQIVKGQTTAAQLAALMGEPFSKAVIDAHSEKWIYQHTLIDVEATSYLVTTSATTTGHQRMLDVLITDGVVVNFSFTDKPMNGQTDVNMLGVTQTTSM